MGNEYVYLAELDSVRTSAEDQIAAERALYREVFIKGNIVVLSYNQIVDSVAFLHLLENQRAYKEILRLFKLNRLMVNQFRLNKSVSQYVQDNFAAKGFRSTYSYISFLEHYGAEIKRDVLAEIVRCLKYSNLEYFDCQMQKMVLSEKIGPSDRKKLKRYVQFLLNIDRYMYKYRCYWPADCSFIQEYPSLSKTMEAITPLIQEKGAIVRHWEEVTRCLKNSRKDTRSFCYTYIEQVRYDRHTECLLKELCDVAYIQRVRSSVPLCKSGEPLDVAVESAFARAEERERLYDERIEPARVKKWFWNKWSHSTGIASAVSVKLGIFKKWWPVAILLTTVVDIVRLLAVVLLFIFSSLISQKITELLEPMKVVVAGAIFILLLYLLTSIIEKFLDKMYNFIPYSRVVPVTGNPAWFVLDALFFLVVCVDRIMTLLKKLVTENE